MATFVLLHGAFAGGWQWRAPARLLQAAGHEVLRPTQTGLGERVHLATPEVGLYTHIEDVVNVFRYEEVHAAILVGYSYSGMVATGVAERIPELISQLVYLDADVPQDGQSEADLYPEAAAYLGDLVREYGGNGHEGPKVTSYSGPTRYVGAQGPAQSYRQARRTSLRRTLGPPLQ